MIARLLAAAVLAALGSPAFADVASVSPTGFHLTYRKEVKAAPADVIAAVGRLDQWWNGSHTYSGKTSNLRLGLRAGDCFCEDWDGNSIEHARVIYVRRDSTVRLDGALGPLQDLGAKGILNFTAAVTEGKTFVTMTYKVSGTADMGMEKLAPIVDRVMGEQFGRWSAYVDGRRP